MKTFKIVDGDISDGYHTFDELYEHRCLIYINLCQLNYKLCAWRPDFEGWFVLYFESHAGQISYHVPNKFLPLIEGLVPRHDEWFFDGHKSKDVADRLYALAKKNAASLERESGKGTK